MTVTPHPVDAIDIPAIRTLEWIVRRRLRRHYRLLFTAAAEGSPEIRIYAVGLLRSLPMEELRRLVPDIEEAVARDARSAAGHLLQDLTGLIAAS